MGSLCVLKSSSKKDKSFLQKGSEVDCHTALIALITPFAAIET